MTNREPQLHPFQRQAIVDRAFGTFLKRMQERMSKKDYNLMDYDLGSYRRRMAQILSGFPYRDYKRSYAAMAPNLPQTILMKGFRANFDTGELGITLKTWAVNLSQFFALWTKVFVLFLSNTKEKKKLSDFPVTIMNMPGLESLLGKSDFVRYCDSGSIDILNHSKKIIVGCGNAQDSQLGKILYTKKPIFKILSLKPHSLKNRFEFVFLHIKTMVLFLIQVVRCPVFSAYHRDFAYHALFKYISDKNLIDHYIIGNGQSDVQELPMANLPNKTFKLNMIWYSTNTQLFVSNVYDNFSDSDPIFNQLFADNSYVWNEDQQEWLKRSTQIQNYKLVGPIHFRVRKKSYERPNPSSYFISVFDVIPHKNELIYKDTSISIYNYYTLENCKNFLNDILKVAEESSLKVTIGLKSKRDFSPRHDMAYHDFISELETSGRIKVIPHDEDIYEVVSRSNLVISIPFSSPTFVAEYLNVPGIFYDPTGIIACNFNFKGDVSFITGVDNLREVFEKHVAAHSASDLLI